MRHALLVTTALAGALIAETATAQVIAAGSPSSEAAAGAPLGEQLEEVVVTAQRRSENLQKAAIAVDVVAGAQLANAGITSPQQLTTVVPSLAVLSNGGATTSFFVRGVGNFTNNGYTDPAIAFNYDGVYIGRPTSTAGLFYDLERIEVLKGPQGTLYGRNATAGAINVIPVKPQIGENSGFVNAGYGNYNAIDLMGGINLAVGSNSALRVSGNLSKHDGYLSDGTSDDDTWGLRAQFLTKPTDNLTVRIAANYSDVGGKGVGANYGTLVVFNPPTNSYAYIPTGFSRSVGNLDPASQAFRTSVLFNPVLGGRFLAPIPAGVYNDNKAFGANAEIQYATEAGTLTVIPAYHQTRLNFWTPAFAGIGFLKDKDHQTSLEARFDGKRIGIFDYLVGGYYFDEEVTGNDTIYQDAFSVFLDYKVKTKSLAAFGRVVANLSDNLRIVGAIRYTHDKKNFDGQNESLFSFCTNFNPPIAFGNCIGTPALLPITDTPAQLLTALHVGAAPARNGPPVPLGTNGAILVDFFTPVNKQLSNGRSTWRAAVEYDLAPQSLLYASVETGYRSGGFSPAFGRETFQPEFITAYTLGSKNRMFDSRLQLNLEVFLWKYRDQQINHFGIDGTGQGNQFTENIARSTNKGFEIDARLLATSTTLLSASLQYLDAKYKDFIFIAPGAPQPPPSTTCGVTAGVNFTVNCSGKPAYNSPKWTLNLGVQQTVPLGDYRLVLAADTQYRSSRYVGFEYLDFQHARSVWRSNASIDFEPEEGRWSLGAYIRNIENDRSLVNSIIYPVGSVSTELTSPPRTYGARVSVKF